MSVGHPSWLKKWPTALVVGLATIGPFGRLKPGPGTWGSLAGLGWQWAVFHHASWPLVVAGTLAVSWLAVGICTEAEVRLGKSDPGEIVIDEFVAMPLCFLGWQALPVADWGGVVGVYALGFGLFRVFDIFKPLGISRLQNLSGGWGVMADDLAASLASCAVLHGAAAVWRKFF